MKLKFCHTKTLLFGFLPSLNIFCHCSSLLPPGQPSPPLLRRTLTNPTKPPVHEPSGRTGSRHLAETRHSGGGGLPPKLQGTTAPPPELLVALLDLLAAPPLLGSLSSTPRQLLPLELNATEVRFEVAPQARHGRRGHRCDGGAAARVIVAASGHVAIGA